MTYNASMKSLKTCFKHFLLFSFLVIVPCTTSFAESDQESFPPLPPGQNLPEGGFKRPQRPPFPPKDPDNIINYRGSRTYTENLPLEIIKTKVIRKDTNMVMVIVIFNQSINPRSVHHDSIMVNNMRAPAGARFSFNKKGDTIRILFPVKEDSFKLKVQNVSSFNGAEIDPVEILARVEEE